MLKPKKQQDQQQQNQQQNQQSQQSQQQKQDEQYQHQQESKPDVPPKLPPTHQPLATGQHSDKQAAVPLAGAGAGGVAQDAGSSSIANAVDAQYHKSADDGNNDDDKAPVSPVGPTPITKDNRTVSEPVSAISADENKPLPVPKMEAAPVTAGKTETAGMQLLCRFMLHIQLANSISAPLPIRTSPQASQPANSENIKPNGSTVPSTTPTTTTAAAAPKTELPPPAKVSSESSCAAVVDEKMPVMAEEPPEIKAKAAAPGMSATSGPLDDFPLEGDKP
jgi:hypothetical protein